MQKVRHFVLSMFKVGLVGFGGGNALIPLLEQVAVDEEKMVSEEDYEEDVVVASITPGALPVEIASGIGRRYIGTKGLLFGGMAMALPGVILTVLLSTVITILNEAVLLQIRYIAVGVTSFICCLLTEYMVSTGRQHREGKLSKYGILVSVIVLVLTCGKNLYRILGLSQKPLFSMATIHVFIMAFFLLLYMGDKASKKRLFLGGLICIAYILCVGNTGLISSVYIKYGIIAFMAVLAVYGFFTAKKAKARPDKALIKRTATEIGWIAVFMIIFIVAAALITPDSAKYVGNGLLSSVMSFGGGDAYLTVADGLFVYTDLIAEGDFYNYLVPIVNILPGSILCKTLSGIGYFLGFSIHGNIWEGVIVAAAGFFVSLFASCGVFDAIGCFYGSFREMYFIQGIRRWIRPIVSGLMVTVMLSLVWQNVKLGNEVTTGAMPVILMLVIYVADLLMVYKAKMKNGSIVFLSAVVSFIGCNLFMQG